MSDLDKVVNTGGTFIEAVDSLLKAIADDDRNAFLASITLVGIRKAEFDTAIGEVMGAVA